MQIYLKSNARGRNISIEGFRRIVATRIAREWTGMSGSGALNQFERSLREAYGDFDIEPIGTSPHARGGMSPIAAGPFRGFRIHAQGVRSIRPALSGTWTHQAFILMPMSGDVSVRHYGRWVSLCAGDLVLMDSREACTIEVGDLGTRSMVIALPRDMLSSIRPNADTLYGHHVAGQRGATRMLSAVLQALDADGDEDYGDEAVARSVTMSLLENALNSSGPEEGRRTRASEQIARMREWAMPQVSDPDFDVEMLGDKFGLSRRSLYRLFAEGRTTPHRWLANLRLELAQRWLMDPTSQHRSVCQIAYAAGFNDSSHFARLFKRRFGTPPAQSRTRN